VAAQTPRSDAAKPTHTINPNPNPENLSSNGEAKANSKPANADEVTTGFGVESTGLEVANPKRVLYSRVPASRFVKPSS
jgi:hypothetical protein